MQLPVAGTRYYLAYDVVDAINPDINRNAVRDATEAIFIAGIEGVTDDVPNTYVIEWPKGAISVYEHVEAA